MKLNYRHAEYICSVGKIAQLPADRGSEVAFVGRSNAGKSSALNAICDIKNLAYTSKTPGRTQTINLFKIDDERRLVDLPGYGYAKVSLSVRDAWQKTLSRYLETRASLQGLVFLMDIRHPLKASDELIISWAAASQLPIHILLTKADKLAKGAQKTTLLQVTRALEKYGDQISCQLFSAKQKSGVDKVKARLDTWLNAK